MPPPEHAEPAVRDSKKLRKTAWILVAIMVAGGWLILKAYHKWSEERADSRRPAVIHRITRERDLRVMRQDGQIVELADLRGKVVVIHAISRQNPHPADRSLAVMRRLAATRATQPEIVLVSLLLDPPIPEQLRPTLAETASTWNMNLPQWWLVSNEAPTVHKFIKNELKAEIYPQEVAGNWNYDPSIVLLDRDGHVRRAVVPKTTADGRHLPPAIVGFDFNQAATWDEKGQLSGTERSNVEELERLLGKTIDLLLDEPATRQ